MGRMVHVLDARWEIEPYDPVRAARLADALNLSLAAAAILVRRGYEQPAAAAELLAAGPRPGLRLAGADGAGEAILRHVGAGGAIAVFGDYDVDGVCSTAMMVRTLRGLGADPTWRLPSRAEGYGLAEPAIRELAAAGVQLLITVDCGVTAVAEVALAQELGIEVVVTDHHRPGERLPGCPVVHPDLGGDGDPGDALCAAGVVLHLARALRARAGLDPHDDEQDRARAGLDLHEDEQDRDLAGLATVCDMVPLAGENRHIARSGLAALARTRRPGLRALMRVADLEAGDVDARTASFRLGPRINAAGRLSRADAALELLLTDDDGRAGEIARELDLLNRDRRETEQRILHEAEARCAPQLAAGALVVAGEGWHPGVVGIVASRLVERHRRPCVVIGLDEQGGGRGSGRSIEAYDLHGGLAACAEHLSRFGGHRMAAGVELDAGAVDGFRAALVAHAGGSLAPADLRRVQRVDAVVSGLALTLELAEELERLGPFCGGNPAPTLLVPAARIEHVTAMGEERRHARCSLVSGGARARGIAFGVTQAALARASAEPQDVAVALERDRWRGAVRGRVLLRSASPARSGHVEDVGAQGFWAQFDRELAADPAAWWATAPAAEPGPAPAAAEARRPAGDAGHPAREASRPAREPRDRRGEGLAAVAGDLLTSGEPLLVVVADVARRRAGLERLAGMAPDGLAVAAWASIGADPSLAAVYRHVLALDPPPVSAGVGLLAAGPGDAVVHLGWGEPEREFTLAHWRGQLTIRPALVELWRALAGAAAGPSGEALAALLRGAGSYPRDGALAARLVGVLSELGLARYEPQSRVLVTLEAGVTDLQRSPAARAYAARLAEAERHLTQPPARSRAVARAG
ncbi:MAG: single-stranded-DNA-specific exonuclease RecJ [Thermoleophilaceae bacterium]